MTYQELLNKLQELAETSPGNLHAQVRLIEPGIIKNRIVNLCLDEETMGLLTQETV